MTILDHVYTVDRIFYDNMRSVEHGRTALGSREVPNGVELRDLFAKSDDELIDYARGLSSEELGETLEVKLIDNSSGPMSRSHMMAHIITHGNYHRGNVGQILAGLGFDLPYDIFTSFMKNNYWN